MEGNTETAAQQMCEKCKMLIGGSRHIPPHDDLRHTGDKEFKSIFGAVDESHYKCKECSKEWLHEDGNSGYGWV